jgi:hypothetical protein
MGDFGSTFMNFNHKPIIRYMLAGLIWLNTAACVFASPPKEIGAQLQAARENLRISQAASERVAAELEDLKKSKDASQDMIHDYEVYLKRLQAMTQENRRVLRQMESAYCRHFPCAKPVRQEAGKDMEPMLNPPIPEEQAVDDVAVLDREFNDALAKFDDMLLKEFDAIRSESAKNMRDLAEEAAEAADRLKEQGIDIEADGETEETGSSGDGPKEAGAGEETPDTEKGATEKESGRDMEEGAPQRQETAQGKADKGDGGQSDANRRGYDKDDDIVARQLREAAENETDPVLKEKLWKEYEAYKKNSL